MFGFLHMNLVDLLDILLVAVIIFYAFRLLRGSQAVSIFIAIVVLYAMRIVCAALNMKLMSGLLGAFLDVGLIALIVIFQPEIRRFLFSLGNTYRKAGAKAGFFARIFGKGENPETAGTINEICKACEEMSALKCGALIVIQKETRLDFIAATGDRIDALVSKRLLENLFFKNSPLHDGAVIVDGERIVAARCTLPITEQDVPASFGMRHKAAIGITDTTDAQVVVVSEQTGAICVVRGGNVTRVTTNNDLKLLLQNAD